LREGSMDERKRLFVDMDGTLFRFHDDIVDEDGVVQIEKMYEPDFFRNLKPFENVIVGVQMFMLEHPEVEVFTCSSVDRESQFGFIQQKNACMEEYLPEVDLEHRLYPAVGTNKADMIPGGVTKNDYLLDDYNKNLEEWLLAGGSPIKCRNNINHRGLGAYGGDKGAIWEGPIVMHNFTPEQVCRDLACFLCLPLREREGRSKSSLEEKIHEAKGVKKAIKNKEQRIKNERQRE